MDLCCLKQAREARPADRRPTSKWDVRHHSHELTGIEILEQVPNIYRMGANQALIGAAKCYFGREPILFDVTYRRDFCTDGQLGVRQWHRDHEADAIFKAIVYLTDVGAEDGGFEYVPRGYTPWNILFRTFPSRWRYSDRAMRRLVPRSQWRKCTGLAGTVVLADTAAIYHHGTNPTREREVVTFSYVPIGSL